MFPQQQHKGRRKLLATLPLLLSFLLLTSCLLSVWLGMIGNAHDVHAHQPPPSSLPNDSPRAAAAAAATFSRRVEYLINDLEDYKRSHVMAQQQQQSQAPPPLSLPLVDCVIVTTQHAAVAAAKGMIHITLRHDASPLACRAFLDLLDSGYYDGLYFFRVIDNFIAQFGVRGRGTNDDNKAWPKPSKQQIDNITAHSLSNTRATLAFAGGNPATRQVFVNLKDNTQLDAEGSRPFAVMDDSSLEFLQTHLYMGYKDGQGQIAALKQGPEAVQQQFPYWSRIESCRRVG